MKDTENSSLQLKDRNTIIPVEFRLSKNRIILKHAEVYFSTFAFHSSFSVYLFISPVRAEQVVRCILSLTSAYQDQRNQHADGPLVFDMPPKLVFLTARFSRAQPVARPASLIMSHDISPTGVERVWDACAADHGQRESYQLVSALWVAHLTYPETLKLVHCR